MTPPATTDAHRRRVATEVLELGEFDLEFALARAGALGEDVQNEGGAVQDFEVEDPLEVAALGGGQLVVEDDGIDIRLVAERREFIGFAFADVGARAQLGQLLNTVGHHLRPGAGGQLGELIQ